MRTFFFLFVIFICCYCSYGYSLPPKRRIDYPLDQDCHLCHAVVIESVNRVGNVVSLENTRKVIRSICKTASFRDYALTPDELRFLCDRFINDYEDKLQISIFTKQMNKYKESVDDHLCNELHFCPNGWSRHLSENTEKDSYMEEEL